MTTKTKKLDERITKLEEIVSDQSETIEYLKTESYPKAVVERVLLEYGLGVDTVDKILNDIQDVTDRAGGNDDE